MIDPSPYPKPGYAALRSHRWSTAGAEYFVTFKVARPAEGLAGEPLLDSLTEQRATLEAKHQWHVRTWVVMPDHLHVLFTLGDNTSLSACLRLFKGRLASALRQNHLQWQDGYFEHCMRSDEDRLPVFLYLFLNPYRAGLLPLSERWSGYYCVPEDWAWFGSLTNSDVPFPEWLEGDSVEKKAPLPVPVSPLRHRSNRY